MTDAEVINNIVMRALGDVHTTLVGRVVFVGVNTIDVQPVTKKVLNGSIIDMPLFKSVPPIFMQGGASSEVWPIAIGDYCLLFVCESNIEKWYFSLDNQQPNEDRKFDYSDSFALVGINPFSTAKPIPTVTTAIGNKVIAGEYIHTGDIVLNGVSLSDFIANHTHGGVSTGGGSTSSPNPL